MNREQKIDFLKGLQYGARSIREVISFDISKLTDDELSFLHRIMMKEDNKQTLLEREKIEIRRIEVKALAQIDYKPLEQ